MEGHLLKLLVPGIRDLDLVDFVSIALYGMSLSCCVLHDLLHVVEMDRIQDVEEVLASWVSILWIFVLEEDVECCILGEILVQPLHRELLVVRDVDILHLLLLQQPLLVVEDLSEEVLVDLGDGWEVVLDYNANEYNSTLVEPK